MIRLVLHQARYDLLTFARNGQWRFFTAALPLIFLIIFVSVFGNDRIGPEHVKASTYYVPGIAGLAVLSAAFSNLVLAVTAQRDLGVLKRRRATPAPAAVIVAGRALATLVVSLVVTTIVIAVGVVAYGVHLDPGSVGALALAVTVGSLALACVGYAVASAIGSADSAQPVVLALTLPLSFVSGVYIPSLQLPSALRHIGQAFPLQHIVVALGRGFLPGTHGIAWGDLAIVAVWGVAGLAVALRRFRWSPAQARA
jgi:ABC-2 type transport system permease protein